jgi:hypothetical protein
MPPMLPDGLIERPWGIATHINRDRTRRTEDGTTAGSLPASSDMPYVW